MPFFTIIIPTYNYGHFLPMAVDSILNQSFEDFQVIIVDNASTDNTQVIAQEYELNDTRVKYIRHAENLERCASRNTGIQNASGTYICFLDSDDYYQEDHLQILHQYIIEKNSPIAFFYTNKTMDEAGKLTKVENQPFVQSNYQSYFLRNGLIPSRVSIHADILQKHQFDKDVLMVEDTDLWMTIASNYPVHHVDHYTVVYRMHDNNSTNLEKHDAFGQRLKGLKKIFKKPSARDVPGSLKRREISYCYFGIAKYQEFQMNYLKMTVALLKSIIINPKSDKTKHKFYLIIKRIPLLSRLVK